MSDFTVYDSVSYAFRSSWNELAEKVHQTAVDKGWWDEPKTVAYLREYIEGNVENKAVRANLTEKLDELADRNDGEMLALFHSEISEALEGLRHGNPPSDKIPEFSSAEEELADVIIRMMDTARARGWDLPSAVLAKLEFNFGREFKHGGKKF